MVLVNHHYLMQFLGVFLVMQKMAKNWELANTVAQSNQEIAKSNLEIAEQMEAIAQRIGGGMIPVQNIALGLVRGVI